MNASHVTYLGMSGASDWQVTALAVERNLVCVTADREDYLVTYARQDVHPGLALIVPDLARAEQQRLFEALLDHLDRWNTDLINKVIEIGEDGSIQVYDWPEPEETGGP